MIRAADVDVHIGANTKDAERGFSRVDGLISSIGGNLAGGVLQEWFMSATRAGTNMVKSFIMANANAETMRNSLEIATGSAERAGEVFSFLENLAANTPFEFPELAEAAVQLESLGFSAERYLTVIGDTAAATGKTINQTTQAFMDASMGEFERLKEFGIQAVEENGQLYFQYMQDGEMMKVAVDRNNSEMIQSTLEMIWNDKYAGAMEKQSKTFNGMLSTIKDNFNLMAMAASKPIFEGLKKGMQGTLKFMKTFMDSMKNGASMIDAFLYALQGSLTRAFGPKIASQITKGIQNIIKAFQSFGKIVASIGKTVFSGLIDAFKLLVKYGTEVSAALKGVAIVFGILLGYSALIGILTGIGAALAFMLSPIGLLIAAGAALGLAWQKNFLGIQDHVDALADKFGHLMEAFDYFRSIGLNPVQAGLRALGVMFPAITDLTNSLQIGVGRVTEAFNSFMDTLGEDGLGAALRGLWDNFLTLAGQLGGWVLDVAVPEITGWLADAAGNVWEALKDAAGWVWDNREDIGQVTLNILGWLVEAAKNLRDAIRDKIYEWLGGGGGDTGGDGTGGATPGGGIPIGSVALRVMDWFVSAAVGIYTRIKEKVFSWLGGGGGASGGGGGVQSGMYGAGNTPGGGIPIGTVAVKIGDWLVSAAKTLGSKIAEFATTAWDAISSTAQKLGTLAVEFADWAVEVVGDLWTKITDYVDVEWESVAGEEIKKGNLKIRVGDWDISFEPISWVAEVADALTPSPAQVAALEQMGESNGEDAASAFMQGFARGMLMISGGGGGGGGGGSWKDYLPKTPEMLALAWVGPYMKGFGTGVVNYVRDFNWPKLTLPDLSFEFPDLPAPYETSVLANAIRLFDDIIDGIKSAWDRISSVELNPLDWNWDALLPEPSWPSWLTDSPQWWDNIQAGRLPWDNGGGGGSGLLANLRDQMLGENAAGDQRTWNDLNPESQAPEGEDAPQALPDTPPTPFVPMTPNESAPAPEVKSPGTGGALKALRALQQEFTRTSAAATAFASSSTGAVKNFGMGSINALRPVKTEFATGLQPSIAKSQALLDSFRVMGGDSIARFSTEAIGKFAPVKTELSTGLQPSIAASQMQLETLRATGGQSIANLSTEVLTHMAPVKAEFSNGLQPSIAASQLQFESFRTGASNSLLGLSADVLTNLAPVKTEFSAGLQPALAASQLQFETFRTGASASLLGLSTDVLTHLTPVKTEFSAGLQPALAASQLQFETFRTAAGASLSNFAAESSGKLLPIKTEFQTHIPTMVSGAVTQFESLKTKISASVSGMATEVSTHTGKALTTSSNNFASINNKAGLQLNLLERRVASTFMAIAGTVATQTSIINIIFNAAMNNLSNNAAKAMNVFASNVQSGFNRAVSAARNGASQIIGAVSGLAGRMTGAGLSIGAALGNGIALGISGAVGRVASAAANLVNSAISAAKNAAATGSPSRRSEKEVGLPIAQGIAVAFDENHGLLESAMANLITAAIQPHDIERLLAGFRGTVYPAVQPEIEPRVTRTPMAFAGATGATQERSEQGSGVYNDNRTINVSLNLSELKELVELYEFANDLDTDRQKVFGRS